MDTIKKELARQTIQFLRIPTYLFILLVILNQTNISVAEEDAEEICHTYPNDICPENKCCRPEKCTGIYHCCKTKEDIANDALGHCSNCLECGKCNTSFFAFIEECQN